MSRAMSRRSPWNVPGIAVQRHYAMSLHGAENQGPVDPAEIPPDRPAPQTMSGRQPFDRGRLIMADLDRFTDARGDRAHSADLAAVRDWATEHVARHKMPREWGLLPSLPLGPSRKVLKRALREQVADGRIVNGLLIDVQQQHGQRRHLLEIAALVADPFP